MGYLGITAAFVILAFLTKSKKGVSMLFGVLAVLSFITWLKLGAGFDFLDFTENPSVEVPEIDMPGVK